MRLIRDILIEDFRSIRRLYLEDIGHAVPLVGANSTGKSNVLRALNLFFKGEVEPGVELDLTRDFHRPRRKVAKRVTVGLVLDVPSSFRIPQSLKSQAHSVGFVPPVTLALKKSWVLRANTGRVDYEISSGPSLDLCEPLDPDGAVAVQRMLDLIRFRYISNHEHPGTLLGREEAQLRTELIGRLKKTHVYQSGTSTEVFAEIDKVARKLIEPISERMNGGGTTAGKLGVETPKDWGEFVWDFALSLENDSGESVASVLQGSGTQAHLAYLLLDFVDNSYGNTFGWRQATIWAVEEPESFLHHDLQTRLSYFLAERSQTERLQLLLTTHNPQFMTVSEAGYLLTASEGATEAEALGTRDLIDRGARGGASPFLHPLVSGRPRPLLIVEGESDKEYIELAYQLHGKRIPWDIETLPRLDPSHKDGGVDAITSYLQENRLAIASRPLGSSIEVLFDWETSEQKRARAHDAVAVHETSRAIIMPGHLANPELDSSFNGIERFLGSEVGVKVLDENKISYHAAPKGQPPYHISKQALDRAKPLLLKSVKERRKAEDLSYLMSALTWLEELPAGLMQ